MVSDFYSLTALVSMFLFETSVLEIASLFFFIILLDTIPETQARTLCDTATFYLRFLSNLVAPLLRGRPLDFSALTNALYHVIFSRLDFFANKIFG